MSKTAKCQNCTYYNAFYRKGIFSFWIERQGLCSKFPSDIVEENNACENWKPCLPPTVTISALDSAMEDIKVLQKVYKKENYTF